MSKLNRKRLVSATWRVTAFFALLVGTLSSELFAQARAVWTATPVAQSNGTTVTMPLKRPVSRANKLTLTIDTRWSQNYGYRPAVVTVKCQKPVNEDRSIVVRIHTGWTGKMHVEQEFILPGGRTSETMTVAIPQYQQSTSFYWWEVWVNGTKDKDLTLEEKDAWGIMQSGGSSAGKSFLALAKKSGERSLVTPASMSFEVLSLAASEFPQRWIDYTCLDVVTLSVDELKTLSAVKPSPVTAIRHWVRAGGQLWVNEVGKEFERLPELSKLLRLSDKVSLETEKDVANEGDGDATKDGWQPVRFEGGMPEGQIVTFMELSTGNVRTVRDPEVIARLQGDPNFSMTGQRYEAAAENSAIFTLSDSSRWFVQQPMGLGKVRAFRETNDVSLFQGASPAALARAAANAAGAVTEESEEMPESLTAALQSVGGWGSRHGLMPDEANVDFANLLVQGVGMAPVTEFRVLITLFVLIIGPLNYFLLKRWRRLHLMVLTVPLAAGVVTFALFGYAVVADGFSTTVRAHSFTALDQRTGESACWTRLSYYSGLTPGGGLVMPTEVALYPIVPSWNPISVDASVRAERTLVWEKEKAKLERGWLRSRTPTQYLTVRSGTSTRGLELTPVRDKMRAKNSLGTGVEYVVVIDAASKYWEGEKLAIGKVAFLKPVGREDAVGKLRKRVRDNAPRIPEALSGDTRYELNNQWRMYSGRYGPYGSGHGLDTNLANIALSELAGMEGRVGLDLPPRSYVAVTETGTEVEFGMEGANEEDSFHVTVGRW